MPSPSAASATSRPQRSEPPRPGLGAGECGRGQARPFRSGGTRLPSSPPATSRAGAAAVALDRLDGVITGGSSSSGMRRSEVSSAKGTAARVASSSPRPSSQASRRRSAPGQTHRPPKVRHRLCVRLHAGGAGARCGPREAGPSGRRVALGRDYRGARWGRTVSRDRGRPCRRRRSPAHGVRSPEPSDARGPQGVALQVQRPSCRFAQDSCELIRTRPARHR